MIDQPQPPKRTDLILVVFALTGFILSVCAVSALLILSAVQGLSLSGSFEPFGLVTAITFLVVGLSGIPLAVISLRRLNDPFSDTPGIPSPKWLFLLFLFPFAIAIGHLTFRSSHVNALIGALAQVLAAAIPAILLIILARRNGPPLSGRRVWTLYLGGAWLAPILSLVAEAIVIIPFGIFILGQSHELPQLRRLIEQFSQGTTIMVNDVQALELLSKPVIWVPVILFVSLIVPMIEEALKSIAIWPLLPRRIPPGEAFVGGVICGAGYAFVEALLLASPDPQWSMTMVARVGATIMHSFTTGVVAWGLARAWNDRSPRRIFIAYGIAVGFHGLWNATTLAIVGFGLKSLTTPSGSEAILLVGAIFGILLLVALATGALVGISQLSKRFNPRDAQSQAIPIQPSD